MTIRIALACTTDIGTINQMRGIAEALSAAQAVDILLRRLRQSDGVLLSIPFVRALLPQPDLLISCSQLGARKARRFLPLCRTRPFWVQIETPEGGGAEPDLVFVSHHDWQPAFNGHANYRKMHGVPHRVDPRILQARRAEARRRLGLGETHTVLVVVGGPNGAFGYDAAVLARLQRLVAGVFAEGGRVLMTVSRRTPPPVRDALVVLRSACVTVWAGEGANPYPDFLAAADAIVVGEDSVTMTCEAIATGKPVYSLTLQRHPGAKLDKFLRFHRHLMDELKATRPTGEVLLPFEPAPFNDTAMVAGLIARHLPPAGHR